MFVCRTQSSVDYACIMISTRATVILRPLLREGDVEQEKSKTFFSCISLKRFSSLWGKKYTRYFLNVFKFFLVKGRNSSIFIKAWVEVVQQPRLTFDLEIETTHNKPSSIRTRSHTVHGSAEEFMVIHVLRRERLPALSCGLPSPLLKIPFFVR